MLSEPDTAPGSYYVTVYDGGRGGGRLLGPFVNDHTLALLMVDAARALAEELDPRAVWYSFGTARWESTTATPGVLNKYFYLGAL